MLIGAEEQNWRRQRLRRRREEFIFKKMDCWLTPDAFVALILRRFSACPLARRQKLLARFDRATLTLG
jgi:hypothetical protein